MPPFPVFKLPDIPLIRVFELIDYESLFTLSFATERSRSLVKKCTSLLNPRISISIYNIFGWHVRADRGRQGKCWYFYNKRSSKASKVDFEKDPYRMINGVSLKFGRFKKDGRVCVSEHPMNELVVLADYLMDTFSADLDYLTLNLDIMENVETMLSVDSLRKSKNLYIKGFCGAETFRRVLDEFETDNLTFFYDTSEAFVYEKPFRMDQLAIYGPEFFNRHNLLTLDCRQVEISNNCLISSDINEFIHQWLQNGDNKLEYLYVSYFREADANVIMEGLETIKGSKKNPECTTFKYIYPKVRFELGRDIRRASDGKLATVFCDGSSLLFVVWQDPNPFL